MPRYSWEARSAAGQTIRGEREAASREAVLEGLRAQGLTAARERAHGREPPAVVAPDVGVGTQAVGLDLVHVQPARLAPPVRARLTEARRDRDHDGALAAGTRDLELAPLRDRALMDVAGEDQVGARLDQPGEDEVPPRDGLLPRPPGRAEEMVMQHDDPERPLGRLVEQRGRPVELRVAYAPRLLPPRPDGVEPDDEEPLTAMDGLRRFPEPLELRPRAREPGRKRVRDVVVPWDREHGPAEPAQQVRRRLELVTAAAVREIAARDHELRLHPLDERGERVVGLLADAAADVQIGDV